MPRLVLALAVETGTTERRRGPKHEFPSQRIAVQLRQRLPSCSLATAAL